MPVTRNGISSTAPTSEEDGERRSTDGGEGSTSRGVPDSASTTSTAGPMFDMSAVLQATVQAAVREAINGIVHLQSQQAAAMPVIGAGETSRLVPLFDPTSSDSPTADAWIRWVDDLAEVYRWSDRLTSCNALARLDGPAKMWYDSLQSVNKTWPEWKVELKRAFPTTSGMQRLHRDMEDRIYRRGKPIESYYYDLSEETCIEYLITGLNDQDSIRAISTRTYDLPEELLRCLKRLEERVGTVSSRDSNHSKASGIQNLAGHGNRGNRAPETTLNESRQNSPSEPRRKTLSNEKGGPRCFKCNKYGHLSLNCPSPQRRARCGVCNRIGHEARNCKGKESGPRLFQSVVNLDIRAADAANEKYFMLAKANGHDVRAYVDLGSQCVTIRREDADRIGVKCTAIDKPLTIGGYRSGRVTPCGEANVNLTVDQATADVPVLIVPNESQAIPLIVGQPFTEQPHVTIPRNINGDCVDDALAKEFDCEIEAKRTSAAERIREDQRKQQARYNKKRSGAPTYEPGDVVLVEREPTACGESRKLKEKYKGQYIITEKLPNDRYRIATLPNAQRGRKAYSSIAPVDKLKRWGQDEIDSEGSGSDSDRDGR
ncbi:hypothetical protein HPB49_012905 [Dermacentor silvarum]|uniref:Uncharacterized protein n=1 Tax=Dermacentor silvarum TaxID=543639 RepID=A0ACB8C3P1_DERSI|nr:hypothetical protein HPB49_012905 [Dermacentor silvarum]